jgi:hypothetical protein
LVKYARIKIELIEFKITFEENLSEFKMSKLKLKDDFKI